MQRTNCILLAAAFVGCVVAPVRASQGAAIKAQLFPLTGEIRLLNYTSTPFDFIFYSVKSESGALDGTDGVWTSITDTYDASGNGFITSTDEWNEISGLAQELTEGAFNPGTFGTLPAFRSISLGNIWDADQSSTVDLVFEVVQADGNFASVDLDYALDGDFNDDEVVNNSDYQIWKLFYGSTSILFADGNINGVVDAADYTIWRDNFGQSLLGSGFESMAASAFAARSTSGVPEPAGAILLLMAAALLSLGGIRAR